MPAEDGGADGNAAAPGTVGTAPPQQDCLECKIIGAGSLTAAGLYNVHLFNKSPKNALGQRVFTALFAAGLLGLAVRRVLV